MIVTPAGELIVLLFAVGIALPEHGAVGVNPVAFAAVSGVVGAADVGLVRDKCQQEVLFALAVDLDHFPIESDALAGSARFAPAVLLAGGIEVTAAVASDLAGRAERAGPGVPYAGRIRGAVAPADAAALETGVVGASDTVVARHGVVRAATAAFETGIIIGADILVVARHGVVGTDATAASTHVIGALIAIVARFGVVGADAASIRTHVVGALVAIVAGLGVVVIVADAVTTAVCCAAVVVVAFVVESAVKTLAGGEAAGLSASTRVGADTSTKNAFIRIRASQTVVAVTDDLFGDTAAVLTGANSARIAVVAGGVSFAARSGRAVSSVEATIARIGIRAGVRGDHFAPRAVLPATPVPGATVDPGV